MSWTLLVGVVALLGLALLITLVRRAELRRMQATVQRRERAVQDGSDKAQLQHPVIDLSRCLGCATCVAVCPESDVLEIVHGQAMVVHGAHCKGISACERECPVGAITVTIQNLDERDDVPVLTDGLEAVGSPGLFLAGEVTAHALIKTAVDHGTAVAAEVSRRVRQMPAAADGEEDVLDLCIVGAGPAGLACSLEAKRNGLDFVTLEQEGVPGGTVAKYPRRKLVMTQPVSLPIYGRMPRTTYTKEELVDLWHRMAAEQELPVQGGETFEELERDESGNYLVHTAENTWPARHVCLALGRRGSPNKLGVPGEELPKVAYSLLDAQSYQGRRILVVGGGDSAVEAAMALAEQPGNEVTLSYRRSAFSRIRSKNQQRLERCIAEQSLDVILESRVISIGPDHVEVSAGGETASRTMTLPNDDVFVMAGGIPPFDLLRRSGVSFDPALRQPSTPLIEQGTGLVRALAAGFVLSVLALAWAVWHADYYMLPTALRPEHPKHAILRPSNGIGLWLGIASCGLIVLNLLYILRRSPGLRRPIFTWGSLQVWMTSHVATGILAFLCATLHGAMAPRRTVGGHAFWALAVLLVTGAIGRYFYAYIPRAANGRELELDEVKAKLGRTSADWDQGQQRFNEHARARVMELIESRQWGSTFPGRVLAMLGLRRDLKKVLRDIEDRGKAEGIADDHLAETLRLARQAHRSALVTAHYEDLRAVLNSWRYVHRWVALLLVLLVVLHVLYALTYGEHILDGGLQ